MVLTTRDNQWELRLTEDHCQRGHGSAIAPCPVLPVVPSGETVTTRFPVRGESKEDCPNSGVFAVLIVVDVLGVEQRGRPCREQFGGFCALAQKRETRAGRDEVSKA